MIFQWIIAKKINENSIESIIPSISNEKKLKSITCLSSCSDDTYTYTFNTTESSFNINGGVHQKLLALNIDHPNAKFSYQTRLILKLVLTLCIWESNKQTKNIGIKTLLSKFCQIFKSNCKCESFTCLNEILVVAFPTKWVLSLILLCTHCILIERGAVHINSIWFQFVKCNFISCVAGAFCENSSFLKMIDKI